MVEAFVLERHRPPVADDECQIRVVLGKPAPHLDLGLELVERRHAHAAPRQRDGKELRAGKVEHRLTRERAEPAESPGQLEVPARIERDDEPDHGLARVPMPPDVTDAELEAR